MEGRPFEAGLGALLWCVLIQHAQAFWVEPAFFRATNRPSPSVSSSPIGAHLACSRLSLPFGRQENLFAPSAWGSRVQLLSGPPTLSMCRGETSGSNKKVASSRSKKTRSYGDQAGGNKEAMAQLLQCKDSMSAVNVLGSIKMSLKLVDYNQVLKICARDGGNVGAARQVFRFMDEANIAGDQFSYNTLLNCIAKSAHSRGERAFKEGISTIDEMKKMGVQPDLYSFNALLNIAAKGASQRGNKEWVSRGLQVLQMMQVSGMTPDVVSYNVLIDACSRAAGVKGSRGRVEEGMTVLRQMREAGVKPDIVSFNSLINVCAKAARVWGSVGVSQASRVLDMMDECDVAPDSTTFNCLLNAYAQAAGAGQVYSWDEVMGVLELMEERGVVPDAYSYNCVMNVCAKTSRVRRPANEVWGWLKVPRACIPLPYIYSPPLLIRIPTDDLTISIFAGSRGNREDEGQGCCPRRCYLHGPPRRLSQLSSRRW